MPLLVGRSVEDGAFDPDGPEVLGGLQARYTGTKDGHGLHVAEVFRGVRQDACVAFHRPKSRYIMFISCLC